MSSNKEELIFEQGQILTVELPFSNIDRTKLRSVLVLSNSIWNSNSRDIIVAKITGTSYEDTFEVSITQEQLSHGKLKKKSFIDLTFVMIVERSLFTKHIATITDETLIDVKDNIRKLFSL